MEASTVPEGVEVNSDYREILSPTSRIRDGSTRSKMVSLEAEGLQRVTSKSISAKPTNIFAKFAKLLSGKWTRLVIYSITCLLTSCVYYGWQQYSEILYKAGAYAWECPEGWDYNSQGPCEAQDKNVGTLYSVGAGSEYSFAVVAGVMFDHMGPRWTGLIGECVFFIGMLVLSNSSQHFNAYIPAMVMCGGCVNVIAFPALVLGELFPKFNALAVSVVLAAQTGCTMVAPILLASWNFVGDDVSFRQLIGYYLLCAALPVTVFYIFALPSREEFDAAREAAKMRALGKNLQLLSQYDIKVEGDEEEIEECLKAAGSLSHILSPYEHDDKEDDLRRETSGKQSHASLEVAKIATHKDGSLRPSCSVAELKAEIEKNGSWKEFFGCLVKFDTLLLALCYCADLLAYNYYPAVVRSAVGEDISSFIGWAMPTEAFWSLASGLMIDYWGTMPVFYMLLAGLAFVYGLTLQDNSGLQYACGCIFIFCQATIFTPKYTFTSEMFDSRHYGKLVGCLGLLGGLTTFINIPITKGDNYKAVFYTYAIATIPLAVLITILLVRQLRGVTYKTCPVEQPPWPCKKANDKLKEQYVASVIHLGHHEGDANPEIEAEKGGEPQRSRITPATSVSSLAAV